MYALSLPDIYMIREQLTATAVELSIPAKKCPKPRSGVRLSTFILGLGTAGAIGLTAGLIIAVVAKSHQDAL